MKTLKEFLITEKVVKNRWEHLLTKEKSEYSDDLVTLVDTAYKHTSLGSFVKIVSDVKNSEWLVLDYNNNPELDIAIFYRKPRASESWKGFKIQGIGHDGTAESKKKLMDRLTQVLAMKGYWIEASDAMESALRKRGVRIEKDNQEKVFSSIVKVHPDGSYDRKIDGSVHKETIFGHPII